MKQEHYIPFDKGFLLEQQIAESTANEREAEDFRRFFDILEHYFHHEAFNLIRKLKQNYAIFDPDLTKEQRVEFKGKSDLSVFRESLLKVLERGNYVQVEKDVIDAAFKHSDLVGLKLSIDFNDFQDYGLYVRGHHSTKEKIRKYYIFSKEI